jgi:hypothetical protein
MNLFVTIFRLMPQRLGWANVISSCRNISGESCGIPHLKFHNQLLNDVAYLLLYQLDCDIKKTTRHLLSILLCMFYSMYHTMIIIDNIKVSNIIFVWKKKADKVRLTLRPAFFYPICRSWPDFLLSEVGRYMYG